MMYSIPHSIKVIDQDILLLSSVEAGVYHFSPMANTIHQEERLQLKGRDEHFQVVSVIQENSQDYIIAMSRETVAVFNWNKKKVVCCTKCAEDIQELGVAMYDSRIGMLWRGRSDGKISVFYLKKKNS